MIEILFELFGELLLQIAIEILVEFGFHSLAEIFHRKPNPWLAAFAYALLGALGGAISLLIWQNPFVTNQTLRLLNLLLTPVAAGLLMTLVGAWRARRGQSVLRIDRFACGYLFALALALVRFMAPQ